MVGLLYAMAFMVLLLVGWVVWNNKPLPTGDRQHRTLATLPKASHKETGQILSRSRQNMGSHVWQPIIFPHKNNHWERLCSAFAEIVNAKRHSPQAKSIAICYRNTLRKNPVLWRFVYECRRKAFLSEQIEMSPSIRLYWEIFSTNPEYTEK